MSIQFASRGPAWFHQWTKAGTVTSQCAEIKRSRGVSGRMSHLQTQLHCFRLLSTQSHSAHWGLQLGHRDAGLIHLAEVQGLELQCRLIKKKRDGIGLGNAPSKNTFSAKVGWSPSLWRCWACFRWSRPFAVDFQDETAWLWSSQEPGKETQSEKVSKHCASWIPLNQIQVHAVF